MFLPIKKIGLHLHSTRWSPWRNLSVVIQRQSQESTPFRWTLANHQHCFSENRREKNIFKIDTAQFYLPPSCSDPVIEKHFCFLPPREIEKEENSNLLSVISSFFFFSTCSIFPFYLRDFLPLPTSSTETANPVTGTRSKNTPVTSHCCYRDNLYCLSSSPYCNRDDQQWPWTSYHLPALSCSLPKLYWPALAWTWRLVITGRTRAAPL